MKSAVAGLVIGTALGSWWTLGWAWLGWLALVALAWRLVGLPSRVPLWLFLGLVVAGGRWQLAARPDPSLLSQLGRPLEVAGWISEEPSVSESSVGLVLITAKGEKFLARAPLYAPYLIGDAVRLRGTLSRPESFLTESGREFDYPGWLAARGIFYELKQPQFELLATADRYPLRRFLARVKNFFLGRIEEVFPEPQSSLLAGLLLGAKKSLGQDWLLAFRRTGVSHVVVLSGYNLTLVAELLRNLLSFLPLWWQLGAAASGIVLFASMAGGGAAVSRATLMALVALMARATGRIYEASRALLTAVALMILWNPRLLVFDLGFQLSILATLGLLFLGPLTEAWFRRVPVWSGVRTLLASTMAAQLAVVPWILYKTGEFSLVAPIVNLLVLGVVPVIMLFGFAASLLAVFSSWLAFPPALVAQGLLSYQLAAVHFFASWRLAAVTFSAWPLGLTLGLYLLIGWCYYRARRCVLW